MKPFIPYEKLAKKRRRELDRQGRAAWDILNPVTRRPDRPDAYNRITETRRWKTDARSHEPPPGGVSFCCPLKIILH